MRLNRSFLLVLLAIVVLAIPVAASAMVLTTPFNLVWQDPIHAEVQRPLAPAAMNDVGAALYNITVTQQLFDEMQLAGAVNVNFRTRGYIEVAGPGPGAASYQYNVYAGYKPVGQPGTLLLTDSQSRAYPPVGPNGVPLVTDYSVTLSAADLGNIAVGDHLFIYLVGAASATYNPDADLAIGHVDIVDATLLLTP